MIYFTADLHFGCAKLVDATRPGFLDVEEHDNELVYQINSMVGRNDRLVIVGDFCHSKPGRYRPRITCRHIDFILGNHDSEAKIRNVFGGNVWQQRMIKLTTGDKVWCSHYPTCFWDMCHWGAYHAYGHIHYNPIRESMMDRGMPGRRSMDVSVDAAKRLLGDWRPFSEIEFLYLLDGQTGHDLIKRQS